MSQIFDITLGRWRPLTTADLAGGGGGNGGTSVTNLTATVSPTSVVVVSDTGTDATIPLADSTNAGVMPPEAVVQLAGLGSAAEADVADFASANHTHALLMTTDERTKLTALPTAADLSTSLAGKMPNTMTGLQAVINGGTPTEKAALSASVSEDLKSDFVFDPATQPNGAITISGVTYQVFPSATSPAPLSIVSGRIAHTTYPAANSAGYLQVQTLRRVTRIGCLAEWPNNATGTIVFVLPTSNWSTGSVTGSSMHLTIYGNGQWTLIRITTPGGVFTPTTIATHSTHGRFTTVWGLGLQRFEVLLDEQGYCTMLWPDGTRSVAYSSFFAAEVTNIALWELYEAAGTEVPAKFGKIWADGGGVSSGGVYADPVAVAKARPAPPAQYNATGTIAIDPTGPDCLEITMTGNITSIYATSYTGFGNRLIELHLIQDATGNRTVTGWNSNFKLSGGAYTPTATAGKRDILTFRADGRGLLYEASRVMNV